MNHTIETEKYKYINGCLIVIMVVSVFFRAINNFSLILVDYILPLLTVCISLMIKKRYNIKWSEIKYSFLLVCLVAIGKVIQGLI